MLHHRPNILVMLDAYLPGYRAGGPIRSINALVEQLGDEYSWRIICPDRDIGDSQPYPGVVPDAWCAVGRAQVFYASRRMLRPWNLLRLIRRTPHDLLYANSFFSPVFSVTPALGRWLGLLPRRPLLIAPRGEFSPGALAIKAYKKRPFVAVAKALGLYKAVFWHCSTSRELDDLRLRMAIASHAGFIARNSFVAQDLVSHKPSNEGRKQAAETHVLNVAFLSRLSPMKNLEFALAVMAAVKVPVLFNIYGPEEDAAYASACRSLAAALPSHVRAVFHGPVAPDAVVSVLAQNDVFLLPTRGENFGHVIVEAWQAGLPVLISDQTPWRGLQQLNLGWDLPLSSAEPFARVLEDVAAWPGEKRRDVAGICRAKAMAILDDRDAVDANRRMFNAVLNAGS